MVVRPATEADIPALVAMSRAFYATTSYSGFAPMADDAVVELARAMIATGTMLVATVDGRVVGMVGLFIAPFMFNHAVRTAHEVVWWVDPDARKSGAGHALLAAVEQACRAAGAVAIQMVHLSNSPPQAAALYERMGYRFSESCYTKELVQWPQ